MRREEERRRRSSSRFNAQHGGCVSCGPQVKIRNMTVAYHKRTALAATLGLAAAAWVVTLRQMHGMDMGVATPLGSFAFFVALWAVMMAAMMLPGLAPAVVRRARTR